MNRSQVRNKACRIWPSLLPIFLVIATSCGLASTDKLPSAARLYTLTLPTSPAEAIEENVEVPLVQRTLRYERARGERRVVFSEGDEVFQLEQGQTLGMNFVAPEPFSSLGAMVYTGGDTRSVAVLTLRDQSGKVLASSYFSRFPDHDWLDLRFDVQDRGRYRLEITRKSEAPLGWYGRRIGDLPATRQAVSKANLPFTVDNLLQYTNQSIEIPAGFKADRLLFLGGLSTYDHGVGWWGDYEAQHDSGDRQFVGDEAGRVQVVYEDGSADDIPLILGWNLWWYADYDSPAKGGPHPEPFLSDPRAAQALSRSLILQPAVPDGLARYYWSFQPRDQEVKLIRLLDNSAKQGFPVISAISVLTTDQSPLLRPLSEQGNLETRTSIGKIPAITGADLLQKRFTANLAALRETLYTTPAMARSAPAASPEDIGMIAFRGNPTAETLTHVFRDNLDDLLTKFGASGKFHTSSQGSANWGGYQGIGTWRDGRGLFYDQSWSRDTGRSVLEAVRLGFMDQALGTLQFADSHLYDLPNGFPRINREKQKVPAHWTTIIDDPLYLDADHKGDGNQENDGHGLLLLGHYTYWRATGNDLTWLRDRWPFISDAADWYVFQLENPSFSRAKDILFTEGESANNQGYDVYSNLIALKSLEKAVEMAKALGDTKLVARWDPWVGKMRDGMLRSLTLSDPQFAATWKITALTWTYGHESLAPLLIGADLDGLEPDRSDPVFSAVTANTYQRQVAHSNGVSAPRSLGYGQSFLTQAALIEDDVANYTKGLAALANYVYYPGHDHYLVPEGAALHPSGQYWYRTGDLGNAVHQAEVLKTLAIVAGIDLHDNKEVRILPRPALGWSDIEVKDYPLTAWSSSLSYQLHLERQSITMNLTTTQPLPSLSVRLGPLPETAISPKVEVNGQSVESSATTIGRWRWVWVNGLQTVSNASLRVSW